MSSGEIQSWRFAKWWLGMKDIIAILGCPKSWEGRRHSMASSVIFTTEVSVYCTNLTSCFFYRPLVTWFHGVYKYWQISGIKRQTLLQTGSTWSLALWVSYRQILGDWVVCSCSMNMCNCCLCVNTITVVICHDTCTQSPWIKVTHVTQVHDIMNWKWSRISRDGWHV